jgi:MFS transporter, MHS family, alpha-ketoglutarate permease
MCMQPAFGALSDKIGRRPMLITFGVLATLCPWPVMTTIARTDQPLVTLGLLMIPLTVMSFYSAISGLFKAELFPIGVRALGVALPYALANSLFGGSAEYVALWFKNAGGESIFYLYVSAVVLVGLLISVAMRDTRTHSRIDHD